MTSSLDTTERGGQEPAVPNDPAAQAVAARWTYRFPPIAFLLPGRDYRGTVAGKTKPDCRAALKRRFRLESLPVGLELLPAKARETGDPRDAAEAGAVRGVYLGKRKEVMHGR
jgi:hypothetical protein